MENKDSLNVVPNYEVTFWNGKQHDAVVIIPVINEGERIKALLGKIHALNIHESADILIVDADSTDGSLEKGFLDSKGVAGVIVKKDRGKLSAQLRCAYAFALDQGYEFLITIDGNNKDEPDAIPAFIEHLKQGYDFVQASRFVKGGIAENTPASRHFAIKLLHAPLLSIASGFKWTDTTQGFRGYSRKMLLDHRIAPFRDVFNTYELLAYLSYRVPLLGYKCIELPTVRRYPPGEVPTKISAFRGNLSLVQILFKACLGHYNPKNV
jgi:glycosyltransferase involved in cell wall biosynthesis